MSSEGEEVEMDVEDGSDEDHDELFGSGSESDSEGEGEGVSGVKVTSNSESFAEKFALGTPAEREAQLAQLLSGSEDYYFYNILHLLNKATVSTISSEEKLKLRDSVMGLLKSFEKLHPKNSKVGILQKRAKFVFFFDQEPAEVEASWNWLAKSQGLTFDYQQQASVQSETLLDVTETSLEPTKYSWETLLSLALTDAERTGSFSCKLTSLGHIRALKDNSVPAERKEEILRALSRPVGETLPQLIAETLTRKKQPIKFGSVTVHQRLTLEQLDALRKLVPSLIDDDTFVATYISRLVPMILGDNHAELEAALQRVRAFVGQLAPVYNDYKASVLLSLLQLGVRTGKFDDDVLMEYLKTPRKTRYCNQNYIQQQENQDRRGVVGSIRRIEGLPYISDSEQEAIIKAHLVHHFETAESIKPYSHYLEETFLQTLFAEVKLLCGAGNPEDHLRALKTSAKRTRSAGDDGSDSKRAKADIMSKGGYEPAVSYGNVMPSYAMKGGYGMNKNSNIMPKGGYAPTTPSYAMKGGYGMNQKADSAEESGEAKLKELKERVELEFVPTNPKRFHPAELVEVQLDVKNVPTLIVKVFEINTINYYRDKQAQVDLNVNLDGLVPNEETLYNYAEPPIRRVRRKYSFPSLNNKRGVFVIDFIGNGKTSRAVIYKGELTFVHKITVAGHVLTVLDENLEPLKMPSVLMESRLYKADADGEIIIPFFPPSSSYDSSVSKKIILIDDGGEFGTLSKLEHQPESYTFQASFHLLKESIVAGRSFDLVIRPRLSCCGIPAPLSLLKDIVLSARFIDHKGTSSVKELKNIKLEDEVDYVTTFQAPEKTRQVTFTLNANVSWATKKGESSYSDTKSFNVNGIEAQEAFADVFLRGTRDEGYVLLALGKSGERLKRFPIEVSVHHTHFSQPQKFKLQTDDYGTIQLGFLTPEVTQVGASFKGNSNDWRLNEEITNSPPSTLRIPFGETLRFNVPFDQSTQLFEVSSRNSQYYIKDLTKKKLQAQNGIVTVSGLGPGTYRLFSRDTSISIEVDAGVEKFNAFITERGVLELSQQKPHYSALKVESITENANQVEIALLNRSSSTRVHVFCSQFVPSTSAANSFSSSVQNSEAIARNILSNVFASGTELGSEIRYVLERKYSKAFPGNSLAKPSLILNPWAIGSTTQQLEEASVHRGAFDLRKAAEPICQMQCQQSLAGGGPGSREFRSNDPSFEFLELPSVAIFNLKPNENGRIVLDRDRLGPGTTLEVVALDNDLRLASKSHNLNGGLIAVRDTRLSPERALNPEKHFSEQNHSTEVSTGQTVVINSSESLQVALYDTLAKVYSLLRTLGKQGSLKEFEFLLSWTTLTLQQKEELYAKYASHELHLFIYKKDKPFFDQVIHPYLKNKLEKTFVDRWLLGENLSKYIAPYEFQKLNPFEMAALAESIPEIRSNVASYMNDVLETQATAAARINELFEAALKEAELGRGATNKNEEESTVDGTRDVGGMGLGGGGGGGGGGGVQRFGRVPHYARARAAFYDCNDMEEEEEEEEEAEEEEEENESFGYGAPSESRKAKAAKYVSARNNAKQMQSYQHVAQTQKLVETNYYQQQYDPRFSVNLFWLGYVKRDRSQPFLSKNVIFATSTLTEVLLALALLDLPLQTANNAIEYSKDDIKITATTPFILFRKVLKQSSVDTRGGVLVSQTFFDPTDRWVVTKGEQIEKVVQDEFLSGKIYGARLVVTNVSSNRKRCSVLTQIPAGSIPVSNTSVTKSHFFDLEGYRTTNPIEYYFYFPYPGQFSQFPAHVIQDEVVIAFANVATFNVVETRTKHDKASWEFLSQMATDEELLEFLKKENLRSIDINKILWRVKASKQLYLAILDILRSRLFSAPRLWSLGIYHRDRASTTEYLQHNYSSDVGPHFHSELFSSKPSSYRHIEYDNILNRRAHPLGGKRQISDDSLREQFKSFLESLAYKATLQTSDIFAAVYYLLLQDRVEEALALFKRIDKAPAESQAELQLQYDYLRCYLDFFSDDPKVARTIAPKYAQFPVKRWRSMFEEVARQLKQIDEGVAVIQQSQDQRGASTSSQEPTLDFEVEGNEIQINYTNLSECAILYYKMDVELLFSSSPFVQQNSGHFSFIRPNIKQTLQLSPDSRRLSVPLPKECENINVMIEIRSEGLRKSKPHFSHSLFVQLLQNAGNIRVCSKTTGKPLPRSYIKVYAKLTNGSVMFYKDGYSDLTGLFSYAQLSKDLLAHVQVFSILVISEKNGTTILEAQPPSGSTSSQAQELQLNLNNFNNCNIIQRNCI